MDDTCTSIIPGNVRRRLGITARQCPSIVIPCSKVMGVMDVWCLGRSMVMRVRKVVRVMLDDVYGHHKAFELSVSVDIV